MFSLNIFIFKDILSNVIVTNRVGQVLPKGHPLDSIETTKPVGLLFPESLALTTDLGSPIL
jgi:hypothetical protein